MAATREAKRAEWSLLFICLPGRTPFPGGVILLDLSADTLYVRLRTDLLDLDEDTQEVISFLAEDLEQAAMEQGGAKSLSLFEKTWSHAFRLNSRKSLTIYDPIQAVQQIFEEHVRAIQEVSGLSTPVFTTHDVLLAQKSIPFSPAVAVRALSALRDPSSSLKEIQAIVTTEPMIAAHLVGLANSALYSPGREVRSVSEALMRLGTDLTTLHVSALMIRQAYSSPDLRRIWNHSVEVAGIARSLCTQLGFEEEATTLVALIHDIGRVVLFGLGMHFSDRYRSLRSQGGRPIQIERDLCGSSHAEIGADLLTEWLFPADMVKAVRNHHEPTHSTSTLEWIVYLAESMSNTNEDIVDLSEHTSVLKSIGIRGTDLLAISGRSGPDLKMLCFAAAA